MDCLAIHTEALAAAHAAAKAKDESMPPEQSRGLDCGFAWVVIKPARGAFVTWAKKPVVQDHDGKYHSLGETRSYGGGGFEIWYSRLHDRSTQSIDVHRAACVAYAEVLQRHGIDCRVRSRLD